MNKIMVVLICLLLPMLVLAQGQATIFEGKFKGSAQLQQDYPRLYQQLLEDYLAEKQQLQKESLIKEDYQKSLQYSLESLEAVQANKRYFDNAFANRESWLNKNIVVSYFGLGDMKKAMKYRDKLYQAHTVKTLPEGLDKAFNFDFFKIKGKNIWGYEWYHELPDDRFSTSFTKIVYYVYDTNQDGSDKNLLYRLHVLMFHKIDNSVDFDYILELQMGEGRRSLYRYTYNKDIDYQKLRSDIKEVVIMMSEQSQAQK